MVKYEQALAGGSRGFTVQFQKRFNDLMSQNQFNPQGFKDLMDEQSRSIRSGAIALAPGADYKKLNAMALDQKERAGDDYSVRGLSGGKKLEDSNFKPPSGDAKSQAEAAIAAGAPRDAVAKKYKELTGKDL